MARGAVKPGEQLRLLQDKFGEIAAVTEEHEKMMKRDGVLFEIVDTLADALRAVFDGGCGGEIGREKTIEIRQGGVGIGDLREQSGQFRPETRR